MDLLKMIFPVSFNVKEKDVTSLVISILIYVALIVVSVVAMKLISLIVILNWLLSIVGWVLDVYAFAGIVIAVLNFLKLLK